MDEYPPGFEFMAEQKQDNPHRIHGFAPGDRVQVIAEDSDDKGKIGRVVNSWGGCDPGEDEGDPFTCLARNCHLVEVDLGEPRFFNGLDIPSLPRDYPVFGPKDIIHVD